MEEIQKNIDVKIAEFERLQKAIKAFQEELVLVHKEYESAEDSKVKETVTLEEQALVSVFDDKKISDFWWHWKDEHNTKNHLGFVDYFLPNENLVVGKEYEFSIGPVMVVGDNVQMLVMLFEANDLDWTKPVGLLIDEYAIGSEAFKKMVKSVFAPVESCLISVELDRIRDAFGTICLKEVDGRLGLDWSAFVPQQTPQSEAFKATWKIAERIKEAD